MSISKNYETFVNAQLLLIYSARSWEDFTYREELEVIKTKLNLQIIYVPRHGDENWTGETGYLSSPCFEKHGFQTLLRNGTGLSFGSGFLRLEEASKLSPHKGAEMNSAHSPS